ncbi:TPA: pLS20_p028 family conjugation system transmembrane protein [Bacillus pacificus]
MAATKIKEWILQFKRVVITGVLTVTTLLLSLIFAPSAFAGWWTDIVFTVKDIDKAEVIAFLKNDWIEYSNIFGSFLQACEGGIIRTLFRIASSLEGLIPETFSFFDILKDAGLNDFASSLMKGLFYALFVLVIVWLGFRTIIQHKPPRFKSVGVNIIIMIGLLGGLNEFMADLQKMSTDFYEEVTEGDKDDGGLAWNLVKHNTADLVYLSTVGFDAIKTEDTKAVSDGQISKNNLNEEMYLKADLGDLISYEVVKKLKDNDNVAKETQFLAYKVTNNGAEEDLESIEESFFNPFSDTFPSGYNRYPMKFGVLFWGLSALVVAYLFTLFVFIMTIFEIAMKKIIAPLVFVTDIETGEKTKMVIQDILRGFLLFAFTGISLRFYVIVVNFLADQDVNTFLYIVAMICLTTALIKGSESILKYFGVDVGLKEGKNNLMSAIGTLATANGLRKGVGNMVKGAKNMMSGSGQTREDTPKRSEMDSEDKDGNPSGEQKNNAKKNGLQGKKLARNTGAALSYVANRGVGGMMNDAGNKMSETVGGAVNKGKDKVSGVAKGVSDGVKGTIDEFKGGQAEGKQKAQDNADRQTLNKIGKDIHNNANSGVEQTGSPKIASNSNATSTASHNASEGTKDKKQKAVQDIEMESKLRNTGRTEGPQGEVKGEKQKAVRDIEMESNLRNTGRAEGPQGEVKGEKQKAIRDIEMESNLRNTGRTEGPQGEVKGEKQKAIRDIEMESNLRNTGRAEGPQGEVKGEKQKAVRDIEMESNLRNTGRAEGTQANVKASPTTAQREVNVQDTLRNSGGSGAANNDVKASPTTAQREVNVQDTLRNSGGSGAANNDVKASPTTAQREVNVQDTLRNSGGSGAASNDVKASPTTAQREVNVQDTLRNSGGSGAASNDVKVSPTTAQREVNIQDTLRNSGGSGAASNDVKVSPTTVQREVNIQDNVKGNGTVNRDVKASPTTVQREVNIQDNVKGNGTVNGDVKASPTTVQREVNIQDNVKGNGTVNRDVKASPTTVQREVNIQDNVKGNGTVSRDVRADSTTVQRDVNVQENVNVKERRGSGLRQRGSSRNRTNRLNQK